MEFQIRGRKSSRHQAEYVTDLDFADDIALLSGEIHQAQAPLERIETMAASVGLAMNAKKTQVLPFDQDKEVSITSKGGIQLEVVGDFKYFGSWMSSTEADNKNRKGISWKACNRLDKFWKSGLSKDLEMRLLTSLVESAMLYGCEACSLSRKQEKGLDGCYTRKALNISWKDYVTNE